MSDKETLLEEIAGSKMSPMFEIAGVNLHIRTILLGLDIDEDATPFEKSSEKDYSLIETICLDDKYRYLLDVILIDYGYEFDDQEVLERQVSESSEIEYRIADINPKSNSVQLKGNVYGDILHLGSCGDFKAKLGIVGVSLNDSKSLLLHQELMIEGYILEKENNIKMAFFTYFTAIEAYLNLELTSIKKQIFSELHHALEYLDLKNKMRIFAKSRLGTNDLNKIKLWGDLLGVFGNVKNKRDSIAHGKSHDVILMDDVNHCFFLVAVLVSIGKSGFSDFNKIKHQLYPKYT